MVRFQVRLPDRLHEKLVERRKKTLESQNEIVVKALTEFLGVEITKEEEKEALLRRAELLSEEILEIGAKKRKEMGKAWTLMCFYGCEEKREPLLCLDQALKDFEEGKESWSAKEYSAKFVSNAEVINVLMLADRYFSLKRRMNEVIKKLSGKN